MHIPICKTVSPYLSTADILAFLSTKILTIGNLRFLTALIKHVSPSLVGSSKLGLTFSNDLMTSI